MFNFRPTLRGPGFNVEAPEEEVPGFRLNADGTIGKAALHPKADGNPFGILERQSLGAFTPVGDGSAPPYLAFARGLHAGNSGLPAVEDGHSAFPGVSAGERSTDGPRASNLLFDPSVPRAMTPVSCKSAGGERNCTTPGGTSFGPLPAPKGFPPNIAADNSSHHEYRYESDPSTIQRRRCDT